MLRFLILEFYATGALTAITWELDKGDVKSISLFMNDITHYVFNN